jgi:hypothetical protein
VNAPELELDERVSVVLLDALARVWSRIRSFHEDVPGVVLLAAPAAHGSPNSLGHFAPVRWRGRRNQADPLHEVLVIAEYLDRPAEQIVETLIHEAAHAANHELGLFDCSASQYHNRQFKKAAEAMGLDVKQIRHYGFALTTLAPGTDRHYQKEIDHLQQVIIHRRRPVLSSGRGPSPGEDSDDEDSNQDTRASASRSRKAVCRCPFIIRVSKKVLDQTDITCSTCGEKFELA